MSEELNVGGTGLRIKLDGCSASYIALRRLLEKVFASKYDQPTPLRFALRRIRMVISSPVAFRSFILSTENQSLLTEETTSRLVLGAIEGIEPVVSLPKSCANCNEQFAGYQVTNIELGCSNFEFRRAVQNGGDPVEIGPALYLALQGIPPDCAAEVNIDWNISFVIPEESAAQPVAAAKASFRLPGKANGAKKGKSASKSTKGKAGSKAGKAAGKQGKAASKPAKADSKTKAKAASKKGSSASKGKASGSTKKAKASSKKGKANGKKKGSASKAFADAWVAKKGKGSAKSKRAPVFF